MYADAAPGSSAGLPSSQPTIDELLSAIPLPRAHLALETELRLFLNAEERRAQLAAYYENSDDALAVTSVTETRTTSPPPSDEVSARAPQAPRPHNDQAPRPHNDLPTDPVLLRDAIDALLVELPTDRAYAVLLIQRDLGDLKPVVSHPPHPAATATATATATIQRRSSRDWGDNESPEIFAADLKFLEGLTLTEEDASAEVVFPEVDPDEVTPVLPYDQLLYRLEERLDLESAYKFISGFKQSWAVEESVNNGVVIKTGFLGPLYCGFSIGDVPAPLPKVFDFIWGFTKPARLKYNTKNDIGREIVSRVGPQCQITYICKNLGPLVTPRCALVNWLYVELPGNRVLIGQKSCTHPSVPEDPRYIRGIWVAAIILAPIRGGAETSVRFVCSSNPRGSIPKVLVHRRFALIMSLIWEAKNNFSVGTDSSSSNESFLNASYQKEDPLSSGSLAATNTKRESWFSLVTHTVDEMNELFFHDRSLTASSERRSRVLGVGDVPASKSFESFSTWCEAHIQTVNSNAPQSTVRKTTRRRARTAMNYLFSKQGRQFSHPPILNSLEANDFEREFRVYNMAMLPGERTTRFIRRGMLFAIAIFIVITLLRANFSIYIHYFWGESTSHSVILWVWAVLALLLFVGPWLILKHLSRHLLPGSIIPTFRTVVSLERCFLFVYITSSISFFSFCRSGHSWYILNYRGQAGEEEEEEEVNPLVNGGLKGRVASSGIALALFSHESIALLYMLECAILTGFSHYIDARIFSWLSRTKCLLFIAVVWTQSVLGFHTFIPENESRQRSAFASVFMVCYSEWHLRCAKLDTILIKRKFHLVWQSFQEKYYFDVGKRREVSTLTEKQVNLLSLVELQTEELEKLGHIPIVRTLNHASIQFEKRIGSGMYGTIYLGEWRSLDVVVKALSTSDLTPSLVSSFLAEMYMLASLRHPNVLNFIGAVLTPPNICMMTEYCKFGTLKRCLREETGMSWPQRKRTFLLNICDGMTALTARDRPVAHLDLNTNNCLVSEDWVVKISGLRNARCLRLGGDDDSSPELCEIGGTPIFMAPEMFLQDRCYDKSVDVFAFGMLVADVAIDGFLENLVERDLLERHGNAAAASSVSAYVRLVSDGWRVRLPAHWTVENPLIVQIIKRCWSSSPGDRPTFEEMREVLYEWNGQLVGRDKKDRFHCQMSLHPYSDEELELLQKGSDLVEQVAREGAWENNSSVGAVDPSLRGVYNAGFSTTTHEVGGISAILGKSSRNVPFKSFEVLEYFWDWLHPRKVAKNATTKSEINRRIVEVKNEHHMVVSSTINFMKNLQGLPVSFRSRLTKENTSCLVGRCVWKETESHSYLLSGAAVDDNAYGGYEEFGLQKSRLNVSWCVTIKGLPDGTCDVEFVCKLVPKTFRYQSVWTNVLTSMFLSSVCECCMHLAEEAKENGVGVATNIVDSGWAKRESVLGGGGSGGGSSVVGGGGGGGFAGSEEGSTSYSYEGLVIGKPLAISVSDGAAGVSVETLHERTRYVFWKDDSDGYDTAVYSGLFRIRRREEGLVGETTKKKHAKTRRTPGPFAS